MKRIANCILALMFIVTLIMACNTTNAVKSGGTYKDIAVASCTDIQLTVAATQAAVAWTKIYFPNKETFFKEKVDPLLADLTCVGATYCEAAQLIVDVNGFADLVTKRDQVAALALDINKLIQEIKN